MRLYLIAIFVALIGLWISSAVQAAEPCYRRSSNILSVQSWKADQAGGAINFTIRLRSAQSKAIRGVGGDVVFVIGKKTVASVPIRFGKSLKAHGEVTFRGSARRTPQAERAFAGQMGRMRVVACVGHVEYTGGPILVID